jgi:flagellar basal body-associated protein FliL
MVKIILIGLWAAATALGSFYGVLVWKSGSTVKVESEALFSSLERVKTDVISVPMISDGQVQGYVLARFVYLADSKKLKELSVKPDVILIDDAFRIIYESPVSDFRRIEKYDLAKLSKRLKDSVNKRLGETIIKDVLVDSINYVARSEIRYKGLKQ